MKKILVVLLVLAVATGVFAQEGEWSFNGTAEIGLILNLDPVPGKDVAVTVDESQYHRPYDGWDGIKGKFGLNYNRDGWGIGLGFTTIKEDDAIVGSLNYGGENFNFAAESNMSLILENGYSFKNLWGNYTFLNGLFFLEASYTHGWAGDKFWASDTTGAIAGWNGRYVDSITGALDSRHTFTMIDDPGNQSYLAANVQLQGLQFGTMIRDIFRGASSDVIGNTYDTPNPFIEGVLRNMIFGIKFEMSPIEVAAQFLVEDYGVYLGGKWYVGPVTVGLSFMGILMPTETTPGPKIDGHYTTFTHKSTEETKMRVGASVDYSADGYGATIKGFLAMDGSKEKGAEATNETGIGYTSQIGVEPGFFYDVIPTHLKFKLDAGFYFFSFYGAGNDKAMTTTKNGLAISGVQFALQPQLFWNFLGTGAGEYGGTGIFFRYRLVGGDATKYNRIGLNNKFDVNFKLSF